MTVPENFPDFVRHTYVSKTVGRERPVMVMVPPNYSVEKTYPVLYILHGYYDNECWMLQEAVHLRELLADYYASGQASEMIVVLPYIFCSKTEEYCSSMTYEHHLCYDAFEEDLFADLKPYIDSHFSVAQGPESTAITGFSMGGRESLTIGFHHPETFGYIGAVCPAPGIIPVAGDAWLPGVMKPEDLSFSVSPAPYVEVYASAADPVVSPHPQTYHDAMVANGTPHTWVFVQDTGHDPSSVYPHLAAFLKHIFKA